MNNKYDIKNSSNQKKIEPLNKAVEKLYQKELKEFKSKWVENISKNCLGINKELDKIKLKEIFREFIKESSATKDQESIKNIWNKNNTLEEKIDALVDFISKDYQYSFFPILMTHFLKIIKNNEALSSFLENPQQFIFSAYKEKTYSDYELHILQMVINDERFNELPSINQESNSKNKVYTHMISYMAQLKLSEYGSSDAIRFEHCIKEGMEKQVIDLSKKEYFGPKVMGLGGSLTSYNEKTIHETASTVKKMKMGACHTFAQLAADHFLTLINEGKMQPMHIKMVSHDAGLGSHTFLLIGHESDDLKDLSKCLIVDPWAVVMGHTETYGIFTTDNYPFPDMTNDLICCYDSQVSNKEEQKSEKLEEKEVSSLTNNSFFNKKIQSKESAQIKAIKFLTKLCDFSENTLGNKIKKEFIGRLIEDVKNQDMSPADGFKLAVDAVFSKSIEKTSNNEYAWKGVMLNKNETSVLTEFNEPAIKNYWKKYLIQSSSISKTDEITKIDSKIINLICDTLNKKETSGYIFGSKPSVQAN
jgi:hypothetical protein